MKLNGRVQLLATIVVIFGAGLASCIDDEIAWREFKTLYNKTYADETEELLRKKVFLDNKHYIESQNTKSEISFTQGISDLSDLTTEEINKSRNGFRLGELVERPIDGLLGWLLTALNESSFELHNNSLATGDRSWIENVLSPASLDYRSVEGRVSKVKDQGSCGSCWAFATTGALESILGSHNRGELLSEQNLVDCSRGYGNYGCSGGLMDAALRYVRDHGIMASRDYPYSGTNGPCRFKRDKSVMGVRGVAILPRANEALLRLVLALTGPLPVAIDAGARSFHSYKSGVYNDDACKNSDGSLNHAVLLVGYGTDKVGGDYWIVKNSWGSKWGDRGYIKMARNHGNMCGIASYVVVPIP